MTDRFSLPRPEGSISTGYDNQNTSDVVIPSCGLEDVDVSLFNLFDKELRLYVNGDETSREAAQRKIPVIFAAGEKWSLLKNGKPLRDKAGTLILPLITILRTGVEQTANDVTGRGINQQTGDLVVKRKLSSLDRNYQSLVNRLLLSNQKNLAVNPGDPTVPDQLLTQRPIGDRSDDSDIVEGALLSSNRLNNIYEVLSVPSPQFYTATYEVTIWTQYTQQMNWLLEVMMSSYLPQGRCFKLTTSKGYWFVAYVDEAYEQQANYEDTSVQERIIKYKLNIRVPAYVFSSGAPGVPIPVRKYVSAPTVDFTIAAETIYNEEYPQLGADDPTLPMKAGNPVTGDYRDLNKNFVIPPRDPAPDSYPRGRPPGNYKKLGTRLVKVSQGSNGESIYRYRR